MDPMPNETNKTTPWSAEVEAREAQLRATQLLVTNTETDLALQEKVILEADADIKKESDRLNAMQGEHKDARVTRGARVAHYSAAGVGCRRAGRDHCAAESGRRAGG